MVFVSDRAHAMDLFSYGTSEAQNGWEEGIFDETKSRSRPRVLDQNHRGDSFAFCSGGAPVLYKECFDV